MNFEQRILRFIRMNNLMPSRGLVLVGVSGGADSLSLLLSLCALRHQLGIDLHVAHFNHQFRSTSLRDERFVVKVCRQLNVPLTVGRRRGGRLSQLPEDMAREMRFKFLIKTANDLHARSVALAHTQNDQAETVLMRLMRGSGLYGLRAILPSRSIDKTLFIRPLLGVNREDVEGYLQVKRMPFCQDPTNDHLKYERNRVRKQLLPLLAKDFNPRIIDVLSGLAVTAGDDYGFLEMAAQKQFKKNVIFSEKKIRISLKSIKRQHPAISRLLLRLMVAKISKDESGLAFEHIHALEALMAPEHHGAVNLPHRLKAVKTKTDLELYYA